MVTTEDVTITCDDGVELHAVLLIPNKPKAVVQFNAGTGAKKEFYQPFLEHLAVHGYVCCLWDYRGSGLSAPPSLKGCSYRFADYGLKDMPAVKAYLRSRFQQLPFMVVAHSAGGQQWGFLPDNTDVKGMLNFGVSVGYAPYMPLGYRLQSYFFFYMFSPLSIALTGYVAAKRFGIMEDLPKNVVREWRDWCSKPNYFFDKKYYGKTVPTGEFKNYPFPVHVVTAVDDTISNERSVPAFWKHVHSHAGVSHQFIRPEQYGVKVIDHFGFFKKNMKDSLWVEAVEKLDSFLAR